ncbi:MAG TPA: tetratricopeptide repeat protein [Bryobacteraceae bacterium]|nr:tetratricopeptide repeat protein [Bryobacteraceae bacterium]
MIIAPLFLFFLQASAYQAGMQAYTAHRFAEAIPWFEKAAASGPDALVAEFMLGNACLQTHAGDQAVQAYAAVFDAGKDSSAAHLITALMMLRAGMTADAAAQAGLAIKADARIPQAHYLLGEAALAQRDYSQAIAEFQKEITRDPVFFMPYYRLGAAYENRGGWDDALATLQRAIWLNPNHNGPYVLIGTAYLERGDVDDARVAWQHAAQMDPHDQTVRRWLEDAAHRQPPANRPQPPAAEVAARKEYLAGHLHAAIPLLEKARASGVRNNELFFLLGNCYLQTHQVAKGRAAFASLYGVPPESAGARLFAAQMLMRLEFEDDAQSELEAAVTRDPKIPEAHYMLGEIAIYRAQLNRAAQELQREIALNPGFAKAYYRLGDTYTRSEDWEHAVPPLQRAVWLDPTYSGPYILLGKTYLKKGNLPEAERMLRRALQMDPQNASAHYLLGRTLIQAGQTAEGKKLLNEWEKLKQSQ